MAPITQFDECVYAFIESGGLGMNVTVPFKNLAYQLAHIRSEQTQLAQAANCLKFKDGVIYANNFDGAGLINDLCRNYHFDLRGTSVLIMGAGGAVQGVLAPLLAQKPREVVIANRTLKRAQELAKEFQPFGTVSGCGFSDIPKHAFDFIIHATSAGHDDNLPAIPDYVFSSQSVCYDLSYGKAALPFLKLAKSHGVKWVLDGLGMLVEQAALSFQFWRGVLPETANVLKKLKKEG